MDNTLFAQNSFSFKDSRYGIIFGGGNGIGFALTKELLDLNELRHLWVTFRQKEKAFELLKLSEIYPEKLSVSQVDPLNEEELESYFSNIQASSLPHLDFCINCIGVLHENEIYPEKSLRDIKLKNLMRLFMVNSAIFPVIAKYLKPLYNKNKTAILATLSAMVASLTENHLGGWYSYRASKTALNMFMKTIAIEYLRSHPLLSVQSIHPGTTVTDLSKPFLNHVKHKVWTPEESAINIMNTIEKSHQEGTGLFKNWDGETISW